MRLEYIMNYQRRPSFLENNVIEFFWRIKSLNFYSILYVFKVLYFWWYMLTEIFQNNVFIIMRNISLYENFKRIDLSQNGLWYLVNNCKIILWYWQFRVLLLRTQLIENFDFLPANDRQQFLPLHKINQEKHYSYPFIMNLFERFLFNQVLQWKMTSNFL